jgi:diaminopimelate epimerase
VRFEKWQALGNDYLLVEADALTFEPQAPAIRTLLARHTGIDADGLIVLHRDPEPDVVARLEIYNPDGSRAELSGNGARQAIIYLRTRGWTDADEFVVRTDAGLLRPTITGPDSCTVDMGSAALASADFPSGTPDGRGAVDSGGRSWEFQHVSIGNPQCAIHVSDEAQLAALDLPAIGPAIEGAAIFPNRSNVSWYSERSPEEIRARIFERGVGETLSSGTGAAGAAIAHLTRLGRTSGSVRVVLDGGTLLVTVDGDLRVDLAGWARPVYAGTLAPELEKEIHAAQ